MIHLKVFSILFIVAGMLGCTTAREQTDKEVDLAKVVGKDWLHAKWIDDEAGRLYVPYDKSEQYSDPENMTGFRLNRDSVFLLYIFDRQGNRQTEIGRWYYLQEQKEIQVAFETQKLAYTIHLLETEPEKLRVEFEEDEID